MILGSLNHRPSKIVANILNTLMANEKISPLHCTSRTSPIITSVQPQLWGGCEEYLLNSLQVLQNRAARTVTRKFWFTPTRILLADCAWLSVRQLIVYHSVLSAHKTVTSGKPLYMHNAMSTAHPLRTRQATGGQIRLGQNFDSKQGLLHDSFRYRAAKDYNNIPVTMRSIRYLPSFKKKLKQWVRSNIPID